LYHLVNSGYASRYGWAKEDFKLMGIKRFIYPAYQSDFNLPAKRPRWSVIDNSRISDKLGAEIMDWKDSLRDIIFKRG
ncbi:MAG: sugar nucleotide-binding protein, partial [candidate division WOR-3 bacterium]|nr:sugar nucleotide-binding protein [candidate division WOR-3 bacterium]